jgi:hypothetical protein
MSMENPFKPPAKKSSEVVPADAYPPRAETLVRQNQGDIDLQNALAARIGPEKAAVFARMSPDGRKLTLGDNARILSMSDDELQNLAGKIDPMVRTGAEQITEMEAQWAALATEDPQAASPDLSADIPSAGEVYKGDLTERSQQLTDHSTPPNTPQIEDLRPDRLKE